MNFDSVDVVLDSFKKGKMIIVVDEESRENEGDLIINAQYITEDNMTFIINNTSGIICVPITIDKAELLGLNYMVTKNDDPHRTAFTVSCDSYSTSTGISSKDRTSTVKSILNNEKVRSPGHMFPLIARDGLLSVRKGHTEASLALCEMSGLSKVAVISEIKNDDGTMKNRSQCLSFAKEYHIPIISIEKLTKVYCEFIKSNSLLSECDFVNQYGSWHLKCYNSSYSKQPHTVLIKGDTMIENVENLHVRVHSECFTGDVLGSDLCDCGNQLNNSMNIIEKLGNGIVIYLTGHEGRGIGLVNKIKAYKLQADGCDTYEANKKLGYKEDLRDYQDVVNILKSFNIRKVTLLTANPSKIKYISKYFEVESKPVTGDVTENNKRYLKSKENYFATMKQEGKNWEKKILSTVALPSPEILANSKIGIISTLWHKDLIDQVVENTISELKDLGFKLITRYEVAGCGEIPLCLKKIISNYDVVICIGLLIKGDTIHFENVATACTNNIMSIQVEKEIPVINGILCCLNDDQALKRVDKQYGLAKSYALTAANMIDIHQISE